MIPADASVSANTPLVPLLAQRNVLVRFPYSSAYLNREGQAESVNWVAVDLEMLERYGVAFRSDWRQLRQSRRWLLEHRDSYAARALNDGVVVLERSQDTTPALERALDQYLQRPMTMDPRQVQ